MSHLSGAAKEEKTPAGAHWLSAVERRSVVRKKRRGANKERLEERNKRKNTKTKPSVKGNEKHNSMSQVQKLYKVSQRRSIYVSNARFLRIDGYG